MKKKQAMKVIAAAGVAIGGAQVFQDGNVVYAAELDQENVDELVFPPETQEAEAEAEEQTVTEPAEETEVTDSTEQAEETEVTDSAEQVQETE